MFHNAQFENEKFLKWEIRKKMTLYIDIWAENIRRKKTCANLGQKLYLKRSIVLFRIFKNLKWEKTEEFEKGLRKFEITLDLHLWCPIKWITKVGLFPLLTF